MVQHEIELEHDIEFVKCIQVLARDKLVIQVVIND